MLSGPPVTTSATPEALLERFQAASARQRRTLVPQLEQQVAQLRPLINDHLMGLDATGDDWAAGFLIQLLVGTDSDSRTLFDARYPSGWLATPSAQGVDYAELQQALALQQFEQADRLTSAILPGLAGADAERRGYV